MTASLPVNFFADYAAVAARQLANWGHTPSAGASSRELVTLFINLGRRRIEPQPRRVVEADDLVVPPQVQTGYDLMKRTAESGGDLNLHLSKSVMNDADYDDAMLNDWGMHHLHLGSSIATSGPSGGLIGRTKELVFAVVRPDQIYVVGVGVHGDWTRKRLLEGIHRNWPELLKGRVVQGLKLANTMTEEEHYQLRKAGIQVISDIGGAGIFSLGGGYATTGRSLEVVMTVDRIADEARQYEARFEKMVPTILVEAAKLGVGPADLDFHYIGVSKGKVLIRDTKANITVGLTVS